MIGYIACLCIKSPDLGAVHAYLDLLPAATDYRLCRAEVSLRF